MKNTTTQFDFSAKPKVTALKPKYREKVEERLDGTNLMNDPRIVRGNTYAAIVQNKNEVQPPPRKLPQKEASKTRERRINFDTGFEVSTPRAMEGREHFQVQTEPFVETLRDRAISYEKECQTDLFLDRPVERQFDPMKGKTGVDRNTQIEENDPELFDFNYEVQPIVEALLSKVLECSRMELYEEENLRQKEKEKTDEEKRRHSRLAEAQMLEAKETRLREETERRQLQYRKANEQESAAHKKVIGRILSKQFLKNLKPNTYRILEVEGFFRQPLETELLSRFAPWLYQDIVHQLHVQQEYKRHSEELLKEAERGIVCEGEKHLQEQMGKREQIAQEKRKDEEQQRLRREEKQRLKEEREKAKADEGQLPQAQQSTTGV